MYGIQCSAPARRMLIEEGVAQKIDEQIDWDRRGNFSIGDVGLDCDFIELEENWTKVEKEIEDGELTEQLLGRKEEDSFLNHAIFAYAKSRAEDSLYREPTSYVHIWNFGDYKTWLFGERRTDRDIILQRANLSSEYAWINLHSPSERGRIREIWTDYMNWSELAISVFDWIGQSRKQELVKEFFEGLAKQETSSLEEIKRAYSLLPSIINEFDEVFQKPIPTIKKREKVQTESLDRKLVLLSSLRDEPGRFVPYISEKNKSLCFAITHPWANEKPIKKRGKPFFHSINEGKKKHPLWRHQEYFQEEIPKLIKGLKKIHDGWEGYLAGPIYRKFLEIYD